MYPCFDGCTVYYTVGYNMVAHIPKGATNIDIRQYAPNNTNDDDTYLGMTASCIFK